MNRYSFLDIRVEAKSEIDNDWRAFLRFVDYEEKLILGIRGYGKTPGEAADDVWKHYQDEMEDNFDYSSFDYSFDYSEPLPEDWGR
jgi:hypothetical protein